MNNPNLSPFPYYNEKNILLELIYCKESMKGFDMIKLLEALIRHLNQYKEDPYDGKKIIYSKTVYYVLANLLEKLHISNKVPPIMRATLNYYLVRNYGGFKNFVCEQYFYLSGEIQNYERTLKNQSDAYEEYSGSVFLCGLYDEFFKLLTENEKASIKYLRYHNPDDKVPDGYEDNLKSSYGKWITMFFAQ